MSESHVPRATAPPEPIAIVGIGCRLPGGVHNTESFWQLLVNGTDAISEIPPERWDMSSFYNPDHAAVGTTYTRRGGFLSQIDQFDAAFFGISPREAASMDPQQRLLLEVAWEAIEDSHQAADALAGSRTGVFVGISTHDYSDLHVKDICIGDAYTNSGGALSIAANRLSYFFDFRGPSMAIDTACSSSLVAVHLACRSLWAHECEAALAGGVNCIITPETTVGFSHANMLSPDGACKAFDASANGYVRGEGAGLILLKPLAKALADGDAIYAVIRATGVNQDGHTNGLTVPSQEAQAALLRDVYAQANIPADRVFYVEAHGTGTPVGDPIEASAIGSVLGAGRSTDDDLRIGSVKTIIGHLEAASGIAGLIKAALVIKHRTLTPNLHFTQPNPRIPFDTLRLRVQQTIEPWQLSQPATVVGVNSFGFGGTNAHVALDEAPAASRAPAPVVTDGIHLLPLSCRSAEGLPALAKRYADFVDDPNIADTLTLAELCHAAGTERSHHEHRIALTARSLEEVSENLEAFIAGEPRVGTSVGRQARRPSLAFVFSGMGPQWSGMARQLLDDEPVFRSAVDACDEIFRQLAGWSIVDALRVDTTRSRMDETEVAQPASFAVQVGLAALWRSWGITPDAIIGHSAGEVAAAYVAGILSLSDAVKVTFHRSRLQQQTTGQGRMLAVGLSAADAAAEVARYHGQMTVGAINSPRAVTLSGDAKPLDDLARELVSRNVFARFIDGAVPYHSHHMDPLKLELLAALAPIVPRRAEVPFYSTVTGAVADGQEIDAEYWWQNVRQPVRFAQGIEAMLQSGVNAFLELSAHPVLARAMAEVQMERAAKNPILPSLRRETDDRGTLLASLGTLYTLGCTINWDTVSPGARATTRLPAYLWQRERCWDESEISAAFRLGKHLHPLLETRLESAKPAWETRLKSQRVPYLVDHQVQGSVMYPAAAYVEMALAAARDLNGDGACAVEDMEFKRPLTLQQGTPAVLQLTLEPQDASFAIYSRGKDAATWLLHAAGKLSKEKVAHTGGTMVPERIQRRSTSQQSGDECYAALDAIGLKYGPQFRGIERVWIGAKESLGHIAFPPEVAAGLTGYRLHPAILDACFQVLSGAASLTGVNGQRGTHFPVKLGRLRFFKPMTGVGLWAHARLTKQVDTAIEGDFTIASDEGEIIAEITGFRCQVIQDPRTAVKDDLADCLYDLQWFPRTAAAGLTNRQANYLPSPDAIAAARPDPKALERFDRNRYYNEIEPLLERVCSLHALEALRQLGWKPTAQQTFTTQSLAKRLHLRPEMRGFLTRVLAGLQHNGYLTADGARWQVLDVPPAAELRRLVRSLLAQHPAYEDTLSLIERSASPLVALLNTEAPPPADLSAEELTDEAKLFEESPCHAVYGFLVEHALKSAVKSLPNSHTLRVLEIGSGTGRVTAAALRALPRHRTEYVFSDRSSALFALARERFGDYAFIDYRTLDLNAELGAQGLAHHSFDVILVADGMRTIGASSAALVRMKSLLASDGLVLVLAPARPTLLHDLIASRLNPAWRSEASHSFLRDQAFTDAGFIQPMAIADGARLDQAQQLLWIARGPHVGAGSRPAESTSAEASASGWVILADRGGVAEELAHQLERLGDTAYLVTAGADYQRHGNHFTVRPDVGDDLQAMLEVASAGQPLRGVVNLWSLDAAEADKADASDFETATLHGTVTTLHLVHALTRLKIATPPRLWLVTRGVHAVAGTDPSGVLQSPLWGLGRVIMNEHQHLRCTLVDLDGSNAATQSERLLQEIVADDVEQEICLRAGSRYAARLVRATAAKARGANDGSAVRQKTPFQLDVSRPGSLDALIHRERRRRKPGTGEVEIEVYTAGLNFRDVMKAMGLYPSEDGDPFWLGDECAGVIARVGPGVEHVQVGDAVVAIAPGCLASFVTCPAEFVVRKPAHLSFEQAATIPTVFMTTHYALNHLARMSASDRVLIHAAAGGVGLAAIQLVKAAGAEIFATAGSTEKREYLASLGVTHLMDSRSLSFADETMRITGGKGVSIVLNSLAGEFIPKSLALLEPTGRFLEIGKIDLYQNSKVGLYPFRSGLSFHTIDMGWVLQHRRELSRTLLLELMAMFETRALEPLPLRTFPIADAKKAFRFMAQAKHIGKIVFTMRDAQPLAIVPLKDEKKTLFRADASYLMTGGLGGFGLAIARWMVDQGARCLVLAGRNGIGSTEAEQAVDAMRAAGATIEIAKVDVSREHDVAELVATIARRLPPLRGVFHAANLMDDGYLLQLTRERVDRVVGPKASGAWHLHRATEGLPLDYFVLFSSVSSWAGSVGQGNYAAANAFLDALSHYRRARKQPVLTVNWGAIAEVGYIARHPDVGRLLDRQGVLGLKPREATTLLGQLLQRDLAEAGAIRLDLRSLAGAQSQGAAYRRFSHLFQQLPAATESADGMGGQRGDLLERLRTMTPDEQQQKLEAILRKEVAGVLGIPVSRLDPQQELRQFGFDSLMSVELEAALESELGIDLPMGFLLGDSITVRAVSQRLAEQIRTASGHSTSGTAAPANAPMIADAEPARVDSPAPLVAREA